MAICPDTGRRFSRNGEGFFGLAHLVKSVFIALHRINIMDVEFQLNTVDFPNGIVLLRLILAHRLMFSFWVILRK